MTEDDALALYDFLYHRISGWDIALACDNPRGRMDYRTKQSKQAMDMMKDIILNSPDFDTLYAALQNDEDPADLWPEGLRDTVRFRLWHVVPRDINEPLSANGFDMRTNVQGKNPWPDFLHEYALPATVADHPPFPPHSKLFEEMDQRHGVRSRA